MNQKLKDFIEQAPKESSPEYAEWLKEAQDMAASCIIDKILAERETKFIPK